MIIAWYQYSVSFSICQELKNYLLTFSYVHGMLSSEASEKAQHHGATAKRTERKADDNGSDTNSGR